LLAALIGAALVGILGAFGSSLKTGFTNLGGSFQNKATF
jgi:Flp pilus assembly pilin Flp